MAKFRVVGVRANGKEYDERVSASSPANAAVKAQLAGVIVTSVTDEAGASHPVPPAPKTPPKKGMGCLGWGVGIVFTYVVLSSVWRYATAPGTAAHLEREEQRERAAAAGVPPPPIAAIPPEFVKTQPAFCEEYGLAPEGRKQAVFSRFMDSLQTESKGLRGVVERHRVADDRSTVDIAIRSGSAFLAGREERRGTKIYDAILGLHEGECVEFSANQWRPLSVQTESKICDPEFLMKLTSIRRCDTGAP